MSADQALDPRLTMVYELLRGLVDQPGAERVSRGQAWQTPFMPPFVSQGKLSATDLLSWWFPAASMTDPWDDYFDQTARVIAGMGQAPAQQPASSFPLPTTLSQMA